MAESLKIVASIALAGALLACEPPRGGNAAAENVGPGASPAADPSRVSRAGFEAKGLKWPLTVDDATLGCTDGARWAEVGGVRYGVNGIAGKARGYAALESIWRLDEEMARQLKEAGIPNEPPLRVNVGDMIEEAGKFC